MRLRAHVLITSITRMKLGYCVGGIDVDTTELIRLVVAKFSDGGAGWIPEHLMDMLHMKIGNILYLELEKRRDVKPPHIEDFEVRKLLQVDGIQHVAVRNWLDGHFPFHRIWSGGISSLFDGCLLHTKRKAWLSENQVSKNSVGFWRLPAPLTLSVNGSYYCFQDDVINGLFEIPFVGNIEPISLIKEGTLVRVSLARWWQQELGMPPRCYLQISGWYD